MKNSFSSIKNKLISRYTVEDENSNKTKSTNVNVLLNRVKLDKKKVLFKHGYSYQIDGNLKLKACYHPSPRNVNSKIINESKMTEIFLDTKKEL